MLRPAWAQPASTQPALGQRHQGAFYNSVVSFRKGGPASGHSTFFPEGLTPSLPLPRATRYHNDKPSPASSSPLVLPDNQGEQGLQGPLSLCCHPETSSHLIQTRTARLFPSVIGLSKSSLLPLIAKEHCRRMSQSHTRPRPPPTPHVTLSASTPDRLRPQARSCCGGREGSGPPLGPWVPTTQTKRTFTKQCASSGWDAEQRQFSVGHSSTSLGQRFICWVPMVIGAIHRQTCGGLPDTGACAPA